MYELMEKTDKRMRRMIGASGFLLWLYETCVPTRVQVMSVIYAAMRISSRLWKIAVFQNIKTSESQRIKRKQAVSGMFFQIANILKTTIGASANYFNAVLKLNMFQPRISL